MKRKFYLFSFAFIMCDVFVSLLKCLFIVLVYLLVCLSWLICVFCVRFCSCPIFNLTENWKLAFCHHLSTFIKLSDNPFILSFLFILLFYSFLLSFLLYCVLLFLYSFIPLYLYSFLLSFLLYCILLFLYTFVPFFHYFTLYSFILLFFIFYFYTFLFSFFYSFNLLFFISSSLHSVMFHNFDFFYIFGQKKQTLFNFFFE